MRSKQVIGVSLTGGLGNQLFQVSAAFWASENQPVMLLTKTGHPRLSKRGCPEVLEILNDESLFSTLETKPPTILNKFFGASLRLGVTAISRRDRFALRVVNWISSGLTTLYMHKVVKAIVGQGVGFFELGKVSRGLILCGYFQSYKWAEAPKVFEKLMKMRPVENSEMLDHYSQIATDKNILVVHIRLGDYVNEPSFGIPSEKYYEKAMVTLWERESFDEIWVFSDTPEMAIDWIPDALKGNCRFIPEVDHSASKTLQLMRYGKGYVLGNSTFSWWAAFLRFNREAPVFIPTKWFQNMTDPVEICPPDWIRVALEPSEMWANIN